MNTVSLDVQDIKVVATPPPATPSTEFNQYFDESFIDTTPSEYVPVDTSELQLDDLEAFMGRLGFGADWEWDYVCEVCDHHADDVHNRSILGFFSEYKKFSNVSCATAIKLYNADWWLDQDNVGMFCPMNPGVEHFHFPAQNVRAAFYGKAFRKIKLQWAKKSKTFICHSDKLSVLYPEYYDTLIAPLKRQENVNENNS